MKRTVPVVKTTDDDAATSPQADFRADGKQARESRAFRMMNFVYQRYMGWRVMGDRRDGYFAWNLRRGWERSRLLSARTLKAMRLKIRKQEHR